MSQGFSDFAASMDALRDPVDFTRKSLGKRCLDTIAENIHARAMAESGPDKWDANQGKYGERKRGKGVPVGRGLRDPKRNRMLDIVEVVGEQDITSDTAIMSAGTDEAMNKLAQWFTAGSAGESDAERSGAENQPARHFYEMTDEDVDDVEALTAEDVADFMAGA